MALTVITLAVMALIVITLAVITQTKDLGKQAVIALTIITLAVKALTKTFCPLTKLVRVFVCV